MLINNVEKPLIKTNIEESTERSNIVLRAQGRLERCNGRVVQGWARLFNSNEPAVVEFYVNDVRVGETVADKHRVDLSKIFNLSCAFEFRISDAFSLYAGDLVRARCVNDTADVIGSPLVYCEDSIT
jgi:hypothetical protein